MICKIYLGPINIKLKMNNLNAMLRLIDILNINANEKEKED